MGYIKTNLRPWANELKKAPCTDCKQSFPPCVMDWDHVRGTKRHSIALMVANRWKKATILAEIAKCDLVCANCHRLRTWIKS